MKESIEIYLSGGGCIVAKLEVMEADPGEKPEVFMWAMRGGNPETQFTVQEATGLLEAWKELLAQHQPRISPPAGQNTNTGKGELYI